MDALVGQVVAAGGRAQVTDTGTARGKSWPLTLSLILAQKNHMIFPLARSLRFPSTTVKDDKCVLDARLPQWIPMGVSSNGLVHKWDVPWDSVLLRATFLSGP